MVSNIKYTFNENCSFSKLFYNNVKRIRLNLKYLVYKRYLHIFIINWSCLL